MKDQSIMQEALRRLKDDYLFVLEGAIVKMDVDLHPSRELLFLQPSPVKGNYTCAFFAGFNGENNELGIIISLWKDDGYPENLIIYPENILRLRQEVDIIKVYLMMKLITKSRRLTNEFLVKSNLIAAAGIGGIEETANELQVSADFVRDMLQNVPEDLLHFIDQVGQTGTIITEVSIHHWWDKKPEVFTPYEERLALAGIRSPQRRQEAEYALLAPFRVFIDLYSSAFALDASLFEKGFLVQYREVRLRKLQEQLQIDNRIIGVTIAAYISRVLSDNLLGDPVQDISTVAKWAIALFAQQPEILEGGQYPQNVYVQKGLKLLHRLDAV